MEIHQKYSEIWADGLTQPYIEQDDGQTIYDIFFEMGEDDFEELFESMSEDEVKCRFFSYFLIMCEATRENFRDACDRIESFKLRVSQYARECQIWDGATHFLNREFDKIDYPPSWEITDAD